MKKLFLIPILSLGVFFTACNDNEPTPTPDENYAEYPYSALTPEQQKEKLAAESDAILEKLDGLSNLSGLELLVSFNALLEIAQPDIESLVDWEDIQDFVKLTEFKGSYTWNATDEVWDYDPTGAASKLTFVLPAKHDGTTNNGKIEISGTGAGTNLEYVDIEAPKDITVALFVDSKAAGTIVVEADNVNKETFADSGSIKVNIDDYSIVFDASREGDFNINSTLKFTKNNEVILDGKVTLDSLYLEEYDDIYQPGYDVNNDGVIDELDVIVDTWTESGIKGFSVELKIGNDLAFVGVIDYKKMREEEDIVHNKYKNNWTESISENDPVLIQYQNELSEIWNKYSDVYLVSRTDKVRIAKLDYKYYDIYISGTNDGSQWIVSSYHSEMNLIFNDNTKVEVEVFFGEGFDDVINAWESFFGKFF